MKHDSNLRATIQYDLETTTSTQRFRQNARVLHQKLQRSMKSGMSEFVLNKRTVGVWKTRNGQRYYVDLKGGEHVGFAARFAAESDQKAKINRCTFSNQEHQNDDVQSLSYWRIPREIQQIYSSKGVQRLYDWQAEALSIPGVADGSRNFIFFTPTSSGKSLIAELLIIRHLMFQKQKCIIILPFVSLVEEKLLDLQSKLYPIGCTCKAFHSSVSPLLTDEIDVAICTIEKASLMLNLLIKSRRLSLITSVIIDELHYISDSQRGYLLETIISKIMLVKRSWDVPIQIVGMSATLPNFSQLADWLNAAYYSCDRRPVPLYQNYVIGTAVYNERHQQWRSFPANMDNSSITIALVQEVLKSHHSVIVFVATKRWCLNLMLVLAQSLNQDDDPRRAELLNTMRIELQGSVCPKLEAGILKGIAYHNSDLPMPVRRLIECGFRSRVINCLCATSTIAAGVNLPARRVIFRSQYVGRQHLSVSQYQQMAGRAGRANLDDHGESYLICEGSSQDLIAKVKNTISAPASLVYSSLVIQNDLNKMILLMLDGIVLQLCHDKLSMQQLISCTFWAALNSCQDTLQSISEEALTYLVENKFVQVVDGVYIASRLGQATCASGFSCSDAIVAYESLDQARLRLCTASPLQLAYLSIPMQSPFRISNNLVLQQKTMECLTSVEQEIAKNIGVDPFLTFKSIGVVLQLDLPTRPSMQRHRRVILAKLLCELIGGERTISSLSTKYNVTPGDVLNLQATSATMANISSVFCQHLRWDSLALLLARFAQLLLFGCPEHLLPLFTIPNMNAFWANALYNNQLESPEDIASSNFDDVLFALKKSAAERKYLADDYIRSVALSIFESAIAIKNHRQFDPSVSC